MALASVLLVDDDCELNEMLVEYLSAEAFTVVAAPNGAAALQQIERRKFDLVILDVMLPALSGFDVLRRVRETLSVPVIMLTARGDDGDRILGFDLGADDYLPKPFNPKELLARMRAVLRRSGGAADNIAQDIAIGRLRLDCASLDANVDGVALRLTAAEFRLLEMLMRSPRRTLSREFLTGRVLGRRLLPNDRSIDTHISNLRRKLGAPRSAGIEIRSIRGAGYMLTGNGEIRS